MKKVIFLDLALVLMLSACGGVQANVPNDTYSKQTQAIVENYMKAVKKHDSDALEALRADDYAFSDCSRSANCYTTEGHAANLYLTIWFGDPVHQFVFHSYNILPNGVFAVIQLSYKFPNDGIPSFIPGTIILKINNGKIKTETWY